jgi:N-acetylglucosaminyl-diphospho-decaprenol L-rhamnosyltransferase
VRHPDNGVGIDLAVALVLHESAAVLPGLLESLDAGLAGVGTWHLVAADNASTDGGPALVEAARAGTTVVRLGANLGYAAGINAAVAAAPPHQALLILNADVALQPGCAAALMAGLERPGVGITVPRLLDADGRLAPSLRRDPRVTRALGEALLGGDRAGRRPALGEVIHDQERYRQPGPADWASGAVWLVSAECLATVGSFDESYFLYSEETDFALRARDAGFRLEYVPEAVARHIGGESGTNPALYALMTRNRVRSFRRRNGRVATVAFRAALLSGELARAAGGRATSRAAAAALLGVDSVLPPPARRASPEVLQRA